MHCNKYCARATKRTKENNSINEMTSLLLLFLLITQRGDLHILRRLGKGKETRKKLLVMKCSHRFSGVKSVTLEGQSKRWLCPVTMYHIVCKNGSSIVRLNLNTSSILHSKNQTSTGQE